MLDDFKKSIQLVLSERIANPFSGAFFFSWFVWNWKTIYFLLGSDSKITLTDRISYVEVNYLSLKNSLFFPFLSAVFLVTVYPFISTGALWVWLKFRKFQSELKNKIEGKRLLTAEQSFAIRLEIQNQEEKFDRLLKSKENEINLLRSQISHLEQAASPSKTKNNEKEIKLEKFDGEIKDFLNNKKILSKLPQVISHIQGNFSFSGLDTEIVGFLTAYDLIKKRDGSSTYDFTDKGKIFLKEYYSDRDRADKNQLPS